MTEQTPGQLRTARAREVRMREADERRASLLSSRGWICVHSDEVEEIVAILRSNGWTIIAPPGGKQATDCTQ